MHRRHHRPLVATPFAPNRYRSNPLSPGDGAGLGPILDRIDCPQTPGGPVHSPQCPMLRCHVALPASLQSLGHNRPAVPTPARHQTLGQDGSLWIARLVASAGHQISPPVVMRSGEVAILARK